MCLSATARKGPRSHGAPEAHRHHGPGPLCDVPFHVGDREAECLVHLSDNWNRATQDHGVGAAHPGYGGDDDLISGADTDCEQSRGERRRAGNRRVHMFDPQQRSAACSKRPTNDMEERTSYLQSRLL